MYTEIDGIKVWGEPIENAVEQMRTCMQTADAGALMADHHKGYAVPIGGVVAYEGRISPSGVGLDIACGNLAVRLDAPGEEVQRNIGTIMDDLFAQLSFGVGRRNAIDVDHDLFDDPAWEIDVIGPLKDSARQQLGTIGSGNHYVDIFLDEQARPWVGVHFGSRGLGHKIAGHYIKAGGGRDGIDVAPVVLDAGSDLGAQYIEAMRLAGLYAYAGREWVCSQVAALIGAPIVEQVHNHHNFAWLEEHGGRKLWVVRKGATPAFPGQRGFVGASMGGTSVILEGVDSQESRDALYSTVHGAGRILSRTQAAGKMKKWGQPRIGGIVDWPNWQSSLKSMGIELRGGGADEAPECYKQLPEVLEAHAPTIRIVHRLTPIGVAMAGIDEMDPYKD